MKTKTSPAPLRLVLASSSIYRRELLTRLCLHFETVSPEIDERAHAGELPAETAVRLAEQKARAVAHTHPDALVIGADQIADFQGRPIGKPRDDADAFEQLRALRGHTIVFHTAVALLNARTGSCRTALVDVVTTFRDVDDASLRAYLDRGRPYDCAGSIKAEALGLALLTRIGSDDPTAFAGLP